MLSRSGRSVYETFDEVSNSPSSLTAARTAMAVGMMRGMRASYRDASNAYLQALIDVELDRGGRGAGLKTIP